MTKKHQAVNPLYKALVKRYESDIASATATLIIYFDNPVGIGEHPQHIDEMDKLVSQIAGAEDNLQALHKHFNNTQI